MTNLLTLLARSLLRALCAVAPVASYESAALYAQAALERGRR